jgi:hypothetical protein
MCAWLGRRSLTFRLSNPPNQSGSRTWIYTACGMHSHCRVLPANLWILDNDTEYGVQLTRLSAPSQNRVLNKRKLNDRQGRSEWEWLVSLVPVAADESQAHITLHNAHEGAQAKAHRNPSTRYRSPPTTSKQSCHSAPNMTPTRSLPTTLTLRTCPPERPIKVSI